MSDAMKLAEEMERAPAGSRELSDRFLLATGWEPINIAKSGFPPRYAMIRPDGQVFVTFRPDPTCNMQDTLDAVPEGWTAIIKACPRYPDAKLYKFDPESTEQRLINQPIHYAATPQLALSAAILRAKEKEDGR